MSRTLAPKLVLLAAAVVVVIVLIVSGGGSGYTVAAVFDSADGMVPGQQVKIAGAVVGTVQSVHVAPGPTARLMMSIQRRFAPFHSDATCTILPEGLISENYVQCNPGSGGTPLARGATGVPTVPLRHTAVPFSLQDVLNVFSMPTDERLRVLISELGIATSGRGQDINGLLLRADPTLQQARRALAIVSAQRVQAGAAVTQTNDVIANLSQESSKVREFVDDAATVSRTTADHQGTLQQSIARLPRMLTSVRPGLQALDRLASRATPLLGDLHAAAPGLTQLTSTLPAFATAGTPAVTRLGEATVSGLPALRAAQPVVSHLDTAVGELGPFANQIDAMLVSLRDTGGIEGTMRLLYTLAALSSEEDSVSHLINFTATAAPQCLGAEVINVNISSCSHAWSAPGTGAVPINEPSCGAQAPINMWEDHYCPVPLPAGLPTLRRSQASSLLSYFLKR